MPPAPPRAFAIFKLSFPSRSGSRRNTNRGGVGRRAGLGIGVGRGLGLTTENSRLGLGVGAGLGIGVGSGLGKGVGRRVVTGAVERRNKRDGKEIYGFKENQKSFHNEVFRGRSNGDGWVRKEGRRVGVCGLGKAGTSVELIDSPPGATVAYWLGPYAIAKSS